MLPQYHSASCRREDGSVMLVATPDSAWARSWDNVNAPKSCLMSEPDRLRTAGAIADATRQFVHDNNCYHQYNKLQSDNNTVSQVWWQTAKHC